MEGEGSSFESSEMVGTFVASTPLLSESWKLCNQANVTAAQGLVANRMGDVTYVAFSGIQPIDGLDPSCRNLVPLDAALFSALLHGHDAGAPQPQPMLHAGFLHLFRSIYNTNNFQNQMVEIMETSKAVVLTGHSIGGTIASLSALWLLCYLQSTSSSTPLRVFCMTFGSPFLGNESLSRAILRERWGGSFCHMVTKHDIVPRLLFAPVLAPYLHSLVHLWHLSMTTPSPTSTYIYLREMDHHHHDEETSKLFHFVLAYVEELARGGEERRCGSFWPFGNFLLCCNEGAICVDNGVAIVKLLHVMLAMGSAAASVEDHLNYGDYVGKVSLQFLRRGPPQQLPDQSSYEAGLELALESSGIPTHEPVCGPAKDCLKMAKRMGLAPNLESASLAIRLSKITPLRAQIEWYKASCDESDDQMGYYDSFKQRGASRRGNKVNMNCLKLAGFWNRVIGMLETNQLPHDFHKREKWVYASQFYKLLVEPLDIAEYYRSGMHRNKGHYIKHGRERRYEIFDRWWRDRRVAADEEKNNKRSKFASLTQDTCFWARVEEAREWLENFRSESDPRKLSLLWDNIDKFEQYAKRMVERKEVSRDVVLKNSSYSLWVDELREFKLQLQQFPTEFPSFRDGEVVP